MIANLEKEMEKVKWGDGGELRLGKEGYIHWRTRMTCSLLVEDEEEIRSIIGKLEGYMEKKRLELRLELNKTKIMKFKKERRRIERRDWRCKGKKIEEVKEFTYLGYKGTEAQVKERVKKAAMVIGEMWGIGKRRSGKDWNKRL